MLVLDSESIKNARITFLLIFINAFCYFTFNIILTEQFILFVQINRKIIEDHEIWRIFTPMFLHIDIIHLFSNMIGLLLFGATIENSRVYSKMEYIFIYLLSGLIGNFFSLILLPLDSISLGASGAIFGLIGAVFILFVTEDSSLLFLALIYVSFFIVSSLGPNINLWAHLFGLLGGILLGLLFKQKDKDLRHY